MAAGSTERTSGYFRDQTPSESKKPCFPLRIGFYHFWRTPLSQPLLDQSVQSARFWPTSWPTSSSFRCAPYGRPNTPIFIDEIDSTNLKKSFGN
jgi:hypothetical protein